MSAYNPATNERLNPADDELPENNSSERPMNTQTASQGHADAIVHTPAGTRGKLDLSDWFDGASDVIKHEDPYDQMETGTREHPSRDYHDEALQVEELRPDTLITSQAFLAAGASATPVQVAWANPERRRLGVYITGTPLALVAQRQVAAQGGAGMAIPTGVVTWFNTTTDLWLASGDNAVAVHVYIVEEVRNSDRN
jgi:hypothetical protein